VVGSHQRKPEAGLSPLGLGSRPGPQQLEAGLTALLPAGQLAADGSAGGGFVRAPRYQALRLAPVRSRVWPGHRTPYAGVLLRCHSKS